MKYLLTITIFLLPQLFTFGQSGKSGEEYFQIGNLFKDLGDYTNTISNYNKAILLIPDGAGAYLNRGIAKKNLHDYRGAIKDFSKVIEITKNNIGFTDLAYIK
jgi:tetratricopeptide (TPR) repeat protein